jgi:hypothetical protein
MLGPWAADVRRVRVRWQDEIFFCNMPYSRGLFERFCDKILVEVARGASGVALPPANVETDAWQDALWGVLDAVCFPRGCVRFWAGGREQGTPRRASALLYFDRYAGRTEDFAAAFRDLGPVLIHA